MKKFLKILPIVFFFVNINATDFMAGFSAGYNGGVSGSINISIANSAKDFPFGLRVGASLF